MNKCKWLINFVCILCVVIGIAFEIDVGIKVIPTPGHTADDVSVVVKTEDLGIVVIAGKISCRLYFIILMTYKIQFCLSMI